MEVKFDQAIISGEPSNLFARMHLFIVYGLELLVDDMALFYLSSLTLQPEQACQQHDFPPPQVHFLLSLLHT